MMEKRFTHKDKSLYIDDDYFCELEDGDEITELLNRQQYTVETVLKKNEQLKQTIKKLEAQLYCPYDSVCINCVNEYLVKKDEYYVSKCKKGHEQCSKSDVKYCDDFELKGDDVE